MNFSPIGLDVTPMALLGAGGGEQRHLQRAVGRLSRQWPAHPGSRQSLQRQPDRRRRNPYSASNLVEPDPGGSQTKHFAHLAHRCPLCWHPLPRAKAKGADPNRASRGAAHHPETMPSSIPTTFRTAPLQFYRMYYSSEAWRSAFSSADLAFCLTAIDWQLAATFDYSKIEPNGGPNA